MNETETKILQLHNRVFCKPAIRCEVTHTSWKVFYADGRCKYSYDCDFFGRKVATEIFGLEIPQP